MKRNYVRLQGNVGCTPKVTTFENGTSVMRFTMATNDRYKNKAGEEVEETVWHIINAWGSLVKQSQTIEKGTYLSVEGKLRPVEYKTKTGIQVKTFDVVASKITLE